MNCAEFESRAADFIDDTLTSPERTVIEEHLASCKNCREFLEDATRAIGLLRNLEDVVPPPELITRIAFQAPLGRFREPLERQGWLSRFISKWLQPVLQPRLAMGMAMTLLSFAMLDRCTGIRVQQIRPADLNPVRIWGSVEDKAIRLKDRALNYYENLRWVYELETRFKFADDQAAPDSQTTQKEIRNSGHSGNQSGTDDDQSVLPATQGNEN